MTRLINKTILDTTSCQTTITYGTKNLAKEIRAGIEEGYYTVKAFYDNIPEILRSTEDTITELLTQPTSETRPNIIPDNWERKIKKKIDTICNTEDGF